MFERTIYIYIFYNNQRSMIKTIKFVNKQNNLLYFFSEKLFLEAKKLAFNKRRRHLHTEPATANVKTKDGLYEFDKFYKRL